MRTILVVQSLIILAGAYYIYTLSQDVTEVNRDQDTPVLPDVTISTTTDNSLDTEPATSASEAREIEEGAPEAEVRIDMDGPTDAGMEFPIFDGELEVR